MTDTDYEDDPALLTNKPVQPNPCSIAWSKQKEALASMRMQIKWSSYVLN